MRASESGAAASSSTAVALPAHAARTARTAPAASGARTRTARASGAAETAASASSPRPMSTAPPPVTSVSAVRSAPVRTGANASGWGMTSATPSSTSGGSAPSQPVASEARGTRTWTPARGASASGRSATLASGSCVPAAPSSAAGPMRTRPPVSHVPRHQVRARHPGSRATCTRGRPPASALSRPAVLAAHMLSTWPVSSMRSSGEYHTSQGRSASAAVGRMPSSGSPSGREMPPEREMLEELSE